MPLDAIHWSVFAGRSRGRTSRKHWLLQIRIETSSCFQLRREIPSIFFSGGGASAELKQIIVTETWLSLNLFTGWHQILIAQASYGVDIRSVEDINPYNALKFPVSYSLQIACRAKILPHPHI